MTAIDPAAQATVAAVQIQVADYLRRAAAGEADWIDEIRRMKAWDARSCLTVLVTMCATYPETVLDVLVEATDG